MPGIGRTLSWSFWMRNAALSGLRELDVGLPQLLIAPVGDVGAQQIGAFRRGPVVECGIAGHAQAQFCR